MTLAASSGKRNVTVWCPSVCLSVCPVGAFTMTHQEAARDAASVHFRRSIAKTDILVFMQFHRDFLSILYAHTFTIRLWFTRCIFVVLLKHIGRDNEPHVYKDWKVLRWAVSSRLFNYNRFTGRLNVTEDGIYYIYAQVAIIIIIIIIIHVRTGYVCERARCRLGV